jgi:hypothetical protein
MFREASAGQPHLKRASKTCLGASRKTEKQPDDMLLLLLQGLCW